MKQSILVLLSLLLFSIKVQSQQNVQLDLSPLKHSKIVLLGEQTHSDGAVFDKKVEIIKHLHQKFGFNIIVFESGMYDNYKAHQLYQNKKEGISIYDQSIFAIWAETTSFKELLDYVALNPEMKILGFDCQESSLFKEHFLPDLKKVFNNNNLNLSKDLYTKLEKTLVYRDFDSYINNKKDSTALYATFKKVQNQFSKIKRKDFEVKILEQTFKSVLADFDFNLKEAQKQKIKIQNPRDKQMAENLIFLQEQYPNEKLIGWGASYHFANAINDFEYTPTTEKYLTELHHQSKTLTSHDHSTLEEGINQIKEVKNAIPMGKILKKHFGDNLYSVGFTSHNGTYFGEDTIEFPILTPPKESLENIFFNKKSKTTLIDKADFPTTKFYTSTLGYLPLFAQWNEIFDGIYYIPTMYPPSQRDYSKDLEKIIIPLEATIEGTVNDNEFNTPVPYVDVYYSSNNKSVITNSNGNFSIQKSKNLNDYLIFSSLGYKSDSIQIKNIKSPIKINLQQTENLVSLNEVVLKNAKKRSAKDILKMARKKTTVNYIQTPFNQNFFYRVQMFRKDSLLYNEEALLETYFKKGNNGTNNPGNNIFGNVLQLRNTTNNFNQNSESGIGDLWVTIIRDIILSKSNVLYHPSSYELKKEGLVEYNGKSVYKISFINTSPGAFSTGYGNPAPISSKGLIYIDKESFAVLHYEHCVTRQEYTRKRFNYKFQRFHKIVQTYKKVNGKYFINLFKVIDKTNYYSKEDNSYISTSYIVNNLMSTDIQIQNVQPIERPIRNLKQKIKLAPNTEFWNMNKFYIEDDSFQFENCD